MFLQGCYSLGFLTRRFYNGFYQGMAAQSGCYDMFTPVAVLPAHTWATKANVPMLPRPPYKVVNRTHVMSILPLRSNYRYM